MNALLASFAFAQPLLLLGLVSLPIIWWLLKATPPAPQRVIFPPARLIFEMGRQEETPHKTPWWLLLLRLLIAALIILGLARPVLNPEGSFAASGPVVLIVDDGWAAAQGWPQRIDTLSGLVARANREDRAVWLLRTTASPDGQTPELKLTSAGRAADTITAMVPRPWAPDYPAVVEALADAAFDGAPNLFWLAGGVEHEGASDLARAARRVGNLTLLEPEGGRSVVLLRRIDGEGAEVEVVVERDNDLLAETVAIRLSSSDGRALIRREAAFEPGQRSIELRETLPVEALNQITRATIEGRDSPAAVALVDSGLKRYRVGLTGTRAPERAQPLLSDVYYLKRALSPFAEVREGEIEGLLQQDMSMLVLADVGQVVDSDLLRLQTWIGEGGVLVRFAGPRLAKGDGALLPVAIRSGGRALEGAMSWSSPARLSPFPDNSPFRGLTAPRDVRVYRQVLAEPSVDLPDRTWAALEDGTPLVTAEAQGKGWLVLVHTSADTTWSDLALSGLFVEMLRRLNALSSGIADKTIARDLVPLSVLDGFGRDARPGANVQPLNEGDWSTVKLGPRHPPGVYGVESINRALNVGTVAPELTRLASLPDGLKRGTLGASREQALGPWLLTAAAMLLLVDLILALMLRGMLSRPRRMGASLGAALLALVLTGGGSAEAQVPADKSVVEATLETRLGFILTGDEAVDRLSSAAMFGLSEVLAARTSVVPGRARAIDIEAEELIFYPMIYWPMVAGQPALSDSAMRRLDRYLRTGGVVLFDTRDDGSPLGASGRGAGPGTTRLRQLLGRIDIGPLEPVGADHVLTRAFYLMDTFPGRYRGGRIWVERLSGAANDGVSPLVIGGADWAAAWAMDKDGRPLARIEGRDRRQREMAYRFGVNLMMYALTGNYKADQVHVPAILERLGQ